jgi:hypothetical protein
MVVNQQVVAEPTPVRPAAVALSPAQVKPYQLGAALRSTPDRLRTIRHALPDLIDRRCSPVAYTREVETAYRTMWETYCRGQQC